MARAVFSKSAFLCAGVHQPEQLAGLGVVIVVLAVIPVVGGALDAERRFGEVRLLLPLAVTVRLVAERAAVVAVDPHGAIPVIAVERTAGRIDRDNENFSASCRVVAGQDSNP